VEPEAAPVDRNLRLVSGFARDYFGDNDHPLYATLKVSENCNDRCDFCDYWMNKVPEVGTDVLKRIIDNISKGSVTVLSFEGGEPTLRPDLKDLLKFAKERSFYVMLTTNGLLLDKVPMDEYAEYFDFLHLSIDEEHRNVYLLDRLKELRKKYKVNVQTVVTKNNLEKLEYKVKKAHEAGAKILAMPVVYYPGLPDLRPDPKKLYQVLYDLKRKYGDTLNNGPAVIQTLVRERRCRSLSISVEPNGDLFYPCPFVGEKIGNLAETPLSVLMSAENAKKGRERMAACRLNCPLYLHAETSTFSSLRALLPYAWGMVKWAMID